MWMSKRHVNNIVVLTGIVALVSFGFLALFSLSLSMTAKEHGQMPHCPFMSQVEVICPIQIGEHIAKWQHAITGIPPETLEFVLAVLVVLTCWRLFYWFFLYRLWRDIVQQRF